MYVLFLNDVVGFMYTVKKGDIEPLEQSRYVEEFYVKKGGRRILTLTGKGHSDYVLCSDRGILESVRDFGQSKVETPIE